MHRAADDCSFQSANGSEASGGCQPTEQATELVAKSPEPELSGMTEIACGSEEFHPPFLFPPRASRGGVGSPHAGSTLRANKRRLARIDAAGSPHKRGCCPLVDPLRVRWRRTWTGPNKPNVSLTEVGRKIGRRWRIAYTENSTIRLLQKNKEKPPRRLDLTVPSHGSDPCHEPTRPFVAWNSSER
jgi:hypothetical protein